MRRPSGKYRLAKYLFKAAYTVAGAKRLLKEGGSARRAAFEKAGQGLGGTVEAYYFSFGEADVVTIVDLPDAISTAALSLGRYASNLLYEDSNNG